MTDPTGFHPGIQTPPAMGIMTAPHTITRITTHPIMTEATVVGMAVALMAAEGVTDQGSGVGSASLGRSRETVLRPREPGKSRAFGAVRQRWGDLKRGSRGAAEPRRRNCGTQANGPHLDPPGEGGVPRRGDASTRSTSPAWSP
jgi:hypothetical protein